MAIDGPRPPDDGDDDPERRPRRPEVPPEPQRPAIDLERIRPFGSRAEHRAALERLAHERPLPRRRTDIGAEPQAPDSEHTAIDNPERTDRHPDRTDREEDLYAFGNKERIKSVRLERDLGVDSPDSIVGPFAPTSSADQVLGKSTFMDPAHAPLSGHFHVLRADAELPPGLGIHADGEDAGGKQAWGHRLIYPTKAMTAAQFRELIDGLDWTWQGFKNKKEP